MAWVKIHDEITGKKLRSLSKRIGCSQNECIGLLVRLWLWGLNNADKSGRMIDTDRDDIADMLRVGLERNIETADVVDAMVECGWIDEDGDELYLHDWSEWQSSWYANLERKSKDAERKRDARKKATEPEEPAAKADEKKSRYAKPFEEFWSAYPRKVGKGEAYAKFKARVSDGWTEEQLITAAKKYAYECEKEHTEQKYVKHPKTFLSDKTPFTDYLPRGLNATGGTMLPTQMSGSSAATDEDPYADWRT